MLKANRKYLPIVLFIVGLLVLVGAYFLIKGRGPVDEEANLPEIPLEQRPYTTLTPSEDGHWLKLEITSLENILSSDLKVASLDYELLYQVGDGRTQGVPGTIRLTSGALIVRDLLLGSESSGKFRYDEGVEEGTLTLRFRNDKGKLVGKLSTPFHLQSNAVELTAVGSGFKYQLASIPEDVFFVTMDTFGLPGPFSGQIAAGPFGVFTSQTGTYPGTVSGATHYWQGEWKELVGGEAVDVAVFLQAGQ